MKKLFLKLFFVGIALTFVGINVAVTSGTNFHNITLTMKNVDALADGEGGGSNCECAGGPGSTSCSCDVWQISCSVSCSSGYYACCSYDGCHCRSSS